MPVRRDADAPTIADPIERTAYERVAGVFAEHCRRCHAEGTRLSSWEAMKGVDMNAYPFGGGTKAEVAKRIRRSIGLDGATATMPKGYGRALSKDDVDRIVAWSESVK